MEILKKLKNLTWEDAWSNYIQYGQHKEPINFDSFGRVLQRELPDPTTIAILEVMEQLKNKMPVYDAFIKATEVVAGLYTNNQCGTTLSSLIKYKKLEIKNIKKGIFDDELSDYIDALYKGYKRFCNVDNQVN